ncbi:phosphate acetyltransferase [bacterium]
MAVLKVLIEKAKKNPKTIVYPEGEDIRILKAADKMLHIENLLDKAILLGDVEKIKANAKNNGINLTGCEIIDPQVSDKVETFAEQFFEIRKHKGISINDAKSEVQKNLIFAGMCVRTGYAHGFVGGCVSTTGDTVRAVLHTIGLRKDVSTLSSFFIMDVPDTNYGDDGLFLFADCGVIIEPSPRQLANITYLTSDAYRSLFSKKARCALLSYSTKGSAAGESVDKIHKALEILDQKYSEVVVDGEMQLDAAIVPEVAKIKMGDSQVAGKANVLIFPDLSSGNIAYKLIQRLAKAEATGPILTGTAQPANDLSRGCDVQDIINVTVVTLLQ